MLTQEIFTIRKNKVVPVAQETTLLSGAEHMNLPLLEQILNII